MLDFLLCSFYDKVRELPRFTSGITEALEKNKTLTSLRPDFRALPDEAIRHLGRNHNLAPSRQFENYHRKLVVNHLSICRDQKLIIVGDSGSGKTSFLRALVGLSSASQSDIKRHDFHSLQVDLRKWTPINESTEEVSASHHQFVRMVADESEVVEDEVVDSRMDEEFVAEQLSKAGFISADAAEEITDKTASESQLLNIWNIGSFANDAMAQTLFYTQNALYVIVFDTSKLLQNKSEEMKRLTTWALSIPKCARATKAILVGTHIDRIDCADEKKKMEILKYLSQEIEQNIGLAVGLKLVRDLERDTGVFFVNNNLPEQEHTAIQRFRKAVSFLVGDPSCGYRGEYILLPERKLSARWVGAMEYISRQYKNLITAGEIQSVASEKFGVTDTVSMLETFAEIGTILWWKRIVKPGNTFHLDEDALVVLNPRWLFDSLSKFFQPVGCMELLCHAPEVLSEEIQEFCAKGFLDQEILKEHYFRSSQATLAPLLSLLQENLLMSRYFQVDHQTGSEKKAAQRKLLIPSSLPQQAEPDEVCHSKEHSIDLNCGLVPPAVVYQQLVCLFLGDAMERGDVNEMKITDTWALFPYLSEEQGCWIQVEADSERILVATLESCVDFLPELLSLTYDHVKNLRLIAKNSVTVMVSPGQADGEQPAEMVPFGYVEDVKSRQQDHLHVNGKALPMTNFKYLFSKRAAASLQSSKLISAFLMT